MVNILILLDIEIFNLYFACKAILPTNHFCRLFNTMKWRRLNGDRIEIPILDAVENTILRERRQATNLKSV